VLAAALYRRWLGELPGRCAAVATLFYAIDPTHGIPVGWIANRNALIATVFALAALLLHDLGVERDSKQRRVRILPYASALALALAFGAGESAIATVVYLAAHAVFLDKRPLGAKIRSLLPATTVTLVWAVVYRAGRFGFIGSGLYHHPMHAPVAFARGLTTNAPLLLASELGVMPDPWPALPHLAKIPLFICVVALLVWAASVIRRLVCAEREDVRRTSRFLLAAGVVSVLPSTAAMPSARLLMIPGFALVGLLAMICGGALPVATSRSDRFFARWCRFVHLTLAPLSFVLTVDSMTLVGMTVRPLAAGIPRDPGAADKRLVVVNAPDTELAELALVDAAGRGGTPPERLLVMAANRRDVQLTRLGERTVLVREEGGFTRAGAELLFRDPRSPLPVGTRIALSDVVVTVTHTTADGVPDEASFDFEKDLDDAYVFRKWDGTGLVPYALPPIGASAVFAGWEHGHVKVSLSAPRG
jgi:hypothetical protein